jgi:hypothetical protein
MKFKALATAAVLMSSATVANAAWHNGGAGNFDGTFEGNGELLFVIFDQNRQVSVMQDLGVRYMEIWDNRTNGDYSLSLTLDPLVASMLSGSTNFEENVRWGVFANNYGLFGFDGYNDPAWRAQGFMITSTQADATYDRANGTDALIQGSQVQGTSSIMQVSTDVNWAANNAVYGDSSNGNYAGVENVFGTRLYNQMPFNVVAEVDDTQYFWAMLFSNLDSQDILMGEFNLDLGNNVLNYSAVPVPAAVWLLASGLLGLGAVARRRKA